MTKYYSISTDQKMVKTGMYLSQAKFTLAAIWKKKKHAIVPKSDMGYDQYIVPDTVAVEATFIAFL